MDTRLALDLGGTKLLVGEVDAGGRVLWRREYPSRGLDQPGGLELMRRALAGVSGTAGWVGAPPPAAGVALGSGLGMERRARLVAFTRTSVHQGVVLSGLDPRLAGLVGGAALAFDLVPPAA